MKKKQQEFCLFNKKTNIWAVATIFHNLDVVNKIKKILMMDDYRGKKYPG